MASRPVVHVFVSTDWSADRVHDAAAFVHDVDGTNVPIIDRETRCHLDGFLEGRMFFEVDRSDVDWAGFWFDDGHGAGALASRRFAAVSSW